MNDLFLNCDEDVIICKEGFFKYDDEEEAPFKITTEEELFSCLRNSCRIQEGTKLYDILIAIEPFQRFFSEYSWCGCFPELLAEARKIKSINKPDNGDLTHLLIHPEIFISSFSSKNEIMNFRNIIGIVGIDENNEDEYERFSISMTPLYEISNLPVKLEYPSKLLFTKKEELKKNNSDNVIDLFKFEYGSFKSGHIKINYSFSLQEVIDAILFELSYYGSPEERDAEKKNLENLVEEIEEDS